MNAKALMIGDWYAFRGQPYRCTASDIASIAECEEKGAPTDISEIPLTTEILEKNGFAYSDLPFEQSWQQYGLSIYGTTGNYHINCGMNVSMDVSNVHELQHVLRLCQIDKTIEL